MPSHNEQVQPTPFDVVEPTPVAPAGNARGQRREGTPGWVVPALGGLVLLAVLVIFWLPERVGAPAPAAVPTETDAQTQAAPASGGATGAKPAGPDVSPWSDAQLAKLR